MSKPFALSDIVLSVNSLLTETTTLLLLLGLQCASAKYIEEEIVKMQLQK